MSNLNFTQQAVFNGLGTFNMGVPEAGNYEISGSLTLPTYISNAQESEVVVTVTINGGAAIYTGTPGNKGFEVKHTMAAKDIFNVTLTSNSLQDKQFNVIKTTITVGEI